MDISGGEVQVSGELFFPVQHVVCYLTQVLVYPFMAIVQLQLQVGTGTGREGQHIGRKVYYCVWGGGGVIPELLQIVHYFVRKESAVSLPCLFCLKLEVATELKKILSKV